MTETNQLGLPLLQPSQAQKHVTVNEAMMRLDALAMLTLQSRTSTTPPAGAVEGLAYAVPVGAVNEWQGQDGRLAIAAGNGWDFADPKRGWRAMILDEGELAIHDGAAWRSGCVTLTPNNAGLQLRVVEVDHAIGAGPVSTTAMIIPAGAVVVGATARVVADITGSLTTWQLGNPGAAGRFGTGLGLTTGSWARGVLGQPTAFYSAGAFQLDAVGGDFASGVVRLAVHFFELTTPDP